MPNSVAFSHVDEALGVKGRDSEVDDWLDVGGPHHLFFHLQNLDVL